jgi:serine/threonine protein kinase
MQNAEKATPPETCGGETVRAKCVFMFSDEPIPTASDPPPTTALKKIAPGMTVFGRYRLEKEIGRGGMGVVWLAHDGKIDIDVALKFLPDVVARDPECVNELKRELRRGLSLTHPGIVRVYSFEQDDDGAAIIMEYVDGPTLSAVKLKQPETCFDPEELMPWIEQLAAALDYAHSEAQVVHRDIKPRNLMLTSKDRIKIADFGVSTSISDTISRISIRKDGSGTPPYMSPQQALGDDPSPADDIYSFGATLYELLTGRPPFYQGNILAQVQQRTPPTMADRRKVLKVMAGKPIPPVWEAAIGACLAKNAKDRPGRASDVVQILKGERQAPKSGLAKSGPLNPALTMEDLPTPLLVRPAILETARSTEKTRDVRGRRQRFHPPRRDKTLGIALLGTIAAIGAAVWWWFGKPDSENESRRVETNEMVEPTPSSPVSTNDVEKRASDAKLLANRQMAEEDEKAVAEGRIPQAGAAWTNTLGMKFAPLDGGVRVLLSIMETRVEDYRAFVEETKRDWPVPEFEQAGDHAAVNVSWENASAFCRWLTTKERAAGRLGFRQRYRLLTDDEWSRVAGLSTEVGLTPSDKNRNIKDVYPWGIEAIPPRGTENLAGTGETESPEKELANYQDGYTHTAPVAHFPPNVSGLYDLGGNVSEWVEDWFDESQTERAFRGSSWAPAAQEDRLSSFRGHLKPEAFAPTIGFRVALDLAVDES